MVQFQGRSVVEMYEKNGGRHLRFEIEADVFLLAKLL